MALPLLLLALLLHPPELATWPEIPPPMSDLARLPSADVCARQLAFFDARRKWLDARRGLYSGPMYDGWFEDAIADNESRAAPWQILSEAREDVRYASEDPYTPEFHTTRCRQCLLQLRTLLGCRNYANGFLPGPIDFRFVRRAD